MENESKRTSHIWTPVAILVFLEVTSIVLVWQFLEGRTADLPFMATLAEAAASAILPLSIVTILAVVLAIVATIAENRRF